MSEGYDTPAPRRAELSGTELDDSELGSGPGVGDTGVGSTGFGQLERGVSEVAAAGNSEPVGSTVGPGTSSGAGGDSTAGVAAGQAKQVGQDALASGQQVAGVSVDQAKSVAAEAGSQAMNLLGEARSQFTDQAATQQNNLAMWLHSIVDELDEMVGRADGSEHSGQATSLVRQLAGRARGAASWLEDHEPSDLLDETSRFARQRPGAFLALAAAGGLLAGRLTRGLTADSSSSQTSQGRTLEAHSGRHVPPAVTDPATVTSAGPYATVAPASTGDVHVEGDELGSVNSTGAEHDDDLGVNPPAGVLGDLGPDHGVR